MASVSLEGPGGTVPISFGGGGGGEGCTCHWCPHLCIVATNKSLAYRT